ncbi:MAG: putative 2OG-Fe(II) oxygenase [Pseudomonadota bacterium]
MAVVEQAKALREQGRWAESARLLAPVVAVQPQNWPATYYYAMALLESGQAPEAQPHFERMVAAGKHLAEARYMLARCHMEQGDVLQAERCFEASHAQKPTALTLRSLSNLDWMKGDIGRFRARLWKAEGALRVYAYGLWIESEDFEAAETAWQTLDSGLKSTADALTLRAQHLRHIGEGAASLEAALAALRQNPGNAAIIDAVTVGYLMCGDGKGALNAIAGMRQAQPHDQHWIAHETTALRLMGDPRFEALVNMDAHVRAYTLPVPEGYESVEALNAGLLEELDDHHRFSNHPLDQSLRAGTQTAQDLLAMRSPAVEAYIEALKGPIRQYLEDIGTAPGHPLTGRNTGAFRFRGCWSVRLRAGGHHVNHVHPQGWISSAYYVSVPQAQDGRAGWIKFGEPSFKSEPSLPPLKWVKPEPGMLVLFPSYMWHGTEPIGRGATRVTAPFDVVPA